MAIGFKPVEANPITATEVRRERQKLFAPLVRDMNSAIADAMLPVIRAELSKRTAGRPPSGKVVVTLRLSPDVVAKFKATGKGWQARMNDALRKATPRPD